MDVSDAVREKLTSVDWFAEMANAVLETAADDPLAGVHRANLLTRFYPIVECAYLIASADGDASEEEMSTVAAKLAEATAGALTHDDVFALIPDCVGAVESDGRDGRISSLAEKLESQPEREAAFMAAASSAWTGGGVGVQEGLTMQAMAAAFGWEIGHMHQLLGAARG